MELTAQGTEAKERDLEGHGGARATKDKGGARGKTEPTGAKGMDVRGSPAETVG